MLSTEGLTKQFSGITAVDNVDFELGADELCSLIGPNGAGKTTFFNLLTGAITPSEGTMWFEGQDITHLSPEETASLGIHRSFQITNVFPNTTVLENVRIAVQAQDPKSSWSMWRNFNSFQDHIDEAYGILDRVGLAERAEEQAKFLSHGEKRKLEVAIALGGDPEVLLLDEPNAGVSSESVGEIIALIEDVAQDHAVLLVEHNMDVVMTVSDRIVVLNQGAIIADDVPENVRGDPNVQEAYLGGYGGDTPETESGGEEGVA